MLGALALLSGCGKKTPAGLCKDMVRASITSECSEVARADQTVVFKSASSFSVPLKSSVPVQEGKGSSLHGMIFQVETPGDVDLLVKSKSKEAREVGLGMCELGGIRASSCASTWRALGVYQPRFFVDSANLTIIQVVSVGSPDSADQERVIQDVRREFERAAGKSVTDLRPD